MFPNYPHFNTPPNDPHHNYYNSPTNDGLNDSTTVAGTPTLHHHQLSTTGLFCQNHPFSIDFMPSALFTNPSAAVPFSGIQKDGMNENLFFFFQSISVSTVGLHLSSFDDDANSVDELWNESTSD